MLTEMGAMYAADVRVKARLADLLSGVQGEGETDAAESSREHLTVWLDTWRACVMLDASRLTAVECALAEDIKAAEP